MSYKKSKIYQDAFQVALTVEDICRTLPRHEQFCLASQLRNSSRSIGANFVEGYVRAGLLPADHRRFLIYSQGSCDETKYWLELGKAMQLIDEVSFRGCFPVCESISRMLLSVIRPVDQY